MLDEGQFAAWVSHMMHGKMLYREFYLQYGPLQVLPLLVFTKLFGVSFFSIRLYLFVFGTLFGIFASILVLRFFKVNQIIMVLTVIFLVLIPGVHIRHWIGIFTLYLLAFSFSAKREKTAFATGVFLALTFLESAEVGIFTFILVACFSGCKFFYKKTRKITVHLIPFLLSGLAISCLSFIVFAVQQGWLLSYLKTTLDVLTSLSGVNLPNGQGLPNIVPTVQVFSTPLGFVKFLFSRPLLFYWSLLLLLIFFSITVIRYIEKRTTEKDDMLLLLIGFGLLSYASIIGRSGHYMLLFPIVLVSGSYFISLSYQYVLNNKKEMKILSIFFFVCFLLYGLRHAAIFRQDFLRGFQQRQLVNTTTFRVAPLAISEKQSSDITRIQAFMNTHAKSSDVIYVFNNIPALYFLLDRENATRYDLPLLASSKKKRLEIVSSLEKNKPKFIIEDKEAWAVDGISDRQRMPEVISYIVQNYKKKNVLNNHLIIYERSEKR